MVNNDLVSTYVKCVNQPLCFRLNNGNKNCRRVWKQKSATAIATLQLNKISIVLDRNPVSRWRGSRIRSKFNSLIVESVERKNVVSIRVMELKLSE